VREPKGQHKCDRPIHQPRPSARAAVAPLAQASVELLEQGPAVVLEHAVCYAEVVAEGIRLHQIELRSTGTGPWITDTVDDPLDT